MTMMWNRTPEDLERWYRKDASGFRTAFEAAPKEAPVARAWAARLAADALPDRPNGFPFAIAVSLGIAAVFLAPYWGSGDLDPEWAVPLMATLAFGPLLAYHGRKDGRLLIGAGVAAVAVALAWWGWEAWPSQWSVQHAVGLDSGLEAAGERVNLAVQARDLMMIHWPMLLAGLTGWAFVRARRDEQRVDFVRHAVQVAILTGLVLAAGGVLLGLTNLLMESANVGSWLVEQINIHLAVWGLSGALVFGHAVWLRHPQALERILPTLARIFIPLFVLVEAGFLVAHLADGFAALSSDREQLFVFNVLLAAVIGLVLLHSAFDEGAPRWLHGLMVALVVLGVLADLVGIAAIASRLGEWGITPNRLTVLIGNLIFLGTLVALLRQWFRPSAASPFERTRKVLNRALAVFVVWSAVVTVVFPLVYGLRVRAADLEAFALDEVPEFEAEEPVIVDEGSR